jgi:hypothetical protein
MKDFARPMPAYWFNARKHYLEKHHGRRYLVGANLAWLAGRTLRRVRRAIELKPDRTRPHLTRDFVAHNFLPQRFRPS